MKSRKSVCSECKGYGLFPYCDTCHRCPKDCGYTIEPIKKEKPVGKYDHLPTHEQKRREAQDKYKAKTDEDDLKIIHRNLVKVGMSGTGIREIDDKLYVLFGPPNTWNYLVPRARE